MATEAPHHPDAPSIIDQAVDFFSAYYEDEIGLLAQRYPRDQRTLVVDHGALFEFDTDLADDVRAKPAQLLPYFDEALSRYELPVDVTLSQATVAVTNLPRPLYPGEVSPTFTSGRYISVQGEVAKSNDGYSVMTVGAYECQRCGTLHRIPQAGRDLIEPYECDGCERKGPFTVNRDQSEFVDAQKVLLQTPPEQANGDGADIEVTIRDDMTGRASPGDRVTISGILRLEQETKRNQNTERFHPYLDARYVDVEQTNAHEADIDPATRKRIEELAARDDALELAAASYHPGVFGYETVKKTLILALVGGAGTSERRGEFHVLLIGDPSTAKSQLIEQASEVGWRVVGVSGTGSTKAGVTAAAVQDNFGDGTWTLEAGSFVKANGGVVAVDELDDMPAEVRSAMLEPMSKQSINFSKGGINTTLETKTAVVAAANPDEGRWNPYEPIPAQFNFSPTLLSRFDLVYTFRDEPDDEEDEPLADHILDHHDAKKRKERGMDIPDGADPDGPVDQETLRHWIALAKQQPKPVYASDAAKNRIKQAYLEIRGMHEYDEDDKVPISWRTLQGIVRVAEAAAKFELSPEITERHAYLANTLVRESLRDVGRDPETGEYDADLLELGASHSMQERTRSVKDVVDDLAGERGAPHDEVVEVAVDAGMDAGKVDHTIKNLLQQGELYEPNRDGVYRTT